MKLLIKNGTMVIPTIKFLNKAPDGVNPAIQNVLIEMFTSE